ncbi:MAG: nitrous oxide-stimulated promoter family protein [Pirellulales bacterium]|nr:nitrous oxide-stimulated promoter family protein [Pirellulales bacterium]
MLDIYCRAHHGRRKELCSQCQDVLSYSLCRLNNCPFGAEKPACSDCPIHCYKRSMREQVREVMRYSGPRMLWRHPILALLHLWDGWWHRGKSIV